MRGSSRYIAEFAAVLAQYTAGSFFARSFGGVTHHRVDILVPLLLSTISFVCSAVIHALPLGATVNLIRRERSRGRVGASFWIDVGIVVRTIFYATIAHLVEVALWAVLFVFCGEFQDFGNAYYHSAVNYTTLGYGDIIMSPRWALLGPLEAASGMLLFGVTAAMVFAVIQKLIEARVTNLKDWDEKPPFQ